MFRMFVRWKRGNEVVADHPAARIDLIQIGINPAERAVLLLKERLLEFSEMIIVPDIVLIEKCDQASR